MWENAQAVELWIRNLGNSHDKLVKDKIVPTLPLKHLYEDSSTLAIEPCNGIELNFWFETQRFESLNILLISQEPTILKPYQGKLPPPYDTLKNKIQVRSELGEPFKEKGAMSWEYLNTTHVIGGWDFYEVKEFLNEKCQVEFHYDLDMNVSLISFSLYDKES